MKWKPNIVGENEAEVYKPNGPVAQLQAMFARMKISKRRYFYKLDTTQGPVDVT